MNAHARRLTLIELPVRVSLLNIQVVCSFANPLKKISLRQTRGDTDCSNNGVTRVIEDLLSTIDATVEIDIEDAYIDESERSWEIPSLVHATEARCSETLVGLDEIDLP